MRRILLLFVLHLCLIPSGRVLAQVQSCRASLSNDTLVLENDLMARRFRWNNGQLITLSLTDKKRNQTWKWVSTDADCVFPGHTTPTGKGELTTKQVVSQPNQTDHLAVSVITHLGSLDVRREFRIYPTIAALNCTFYLRGKASPEWQQAAGKSAAGMDFKNIESQNDLNKFAAAVPVMDKLALAGNHWRGRAVEFADMTDRNNTLVTEVPYNLYRQPGFLKGNLLWLTDGLSGSSFFVLKESPVSVIQLANPGFDFLVKNGSVQTVGAGILPSDVSETDWVRGYGYTLGLGGSSELDGLQTLRSYQDAKRPRRADRDEMIMMNTWGDRNKDTKIREQFIITELQKAAQLGVTRFQIDDGWELGKSMNSATPGGSSEDIWKNPNYWKPDPERFPNGLKPVIDAAKKLGIELGLWFSPSVDNSFAHWDKDAQALIGLYKQYGIRTFKIDLVQIPDKTAETNFRKFLDTVMAATNYEVIFNMDVTAGRRNGYHFMNEYGNLFLENRYTDWTNYYPYWTLRNLWNLSKYVPSQNLQIEFLNKWRNADKYPAGDRFAPANYSFDYLFAITMMAQPLAWFEATGLPAEAFQTATLIKTYRTIQTQVHGGHILPIGDEPSGKSWTGFQSIRSEKEGFLLVFREDTPNAQETVKTWLPAGKRVRLQTVAGAGKAFEQVVTGEGNLLMTLPAANNFALYRYTVMN
ncbi:alpha-galactosidase [Spirosoma fluviale]|uniref:Melibiase n=1 Tax=Spirosoma fluviale TaxID=1597977 RepID=A0A286GUS8_9BACT|nr:alpha-galactosidase [Spirosoma fluviale]SOD99317.1 Melibiase [Spirosoma fluviale]